MIMYLYICNIIICLYYYIYIYIKLPPYPLYNTSILLIFLNPKPSIEDVVQDRTCSKALGLIIG